MARKFDAVTLNTLKREGEVRIRPGKSTKRGVIIWIVATGEDAYVRSVQAAQGKWFQRVAQSKEATLEIGDRLIPVTATPVADTATLDAVSAEYLRKYATSPYAKSMTRPETLPTTLRLQPR
jgi:hypothetical protein